MAATARARSQAGVDLWAEAWSLEARSSASSGSAASPRSASGKAGIRVAAQPKPVRQDRRQQQNRPTPRPPAPARVSRAAAAKAKRPAARRWRANRRSLIPVGLVLVALSVLLLTPLLLNVAAMRAEWQVSQLQMREDDLATERSALRAKVAALSSTQRLAEQASALGLEPANPVDYLFLNESAPLASEVDGVALDGAPAGG